MRAGRKIVIDISLSSVFKAVLMIIGLYFLYYLREIAALTFVALIFSLALSPAINKLQSRGIRPAIGLLIIFISVLSVFVLSVVLLIPPISAQVRELYKNFPQLLEKLPFDTGKIREFSFMDIWQRRELSLQNIQKISGYFIIFLGGIFGGIGAIFIIMVIIFYLFLEKENLGYLLVFIPKERQERILKVLDRVKVKLNAWLMGQLFLCLIIGLLSFIGLVIGGIDYSLVLSLFAGLSELIPYVGPVLGAIPAIFIAYTTSTPWRTVFVLVWFILIQQAENNFIVPKVMERTVKVSPLAIVIGLLVGVKLAGIAGVILTVPVVAMISEVLKDVIDHGNNKDIYN